jgi:hypothetical protein
MHPPRAVVCYHLATQDRRIRQDVADNRQVRQEELIFLAKTVAP